MGDATITTADGGDTVTYRTDVPGGGWVAKEVWFPADGPAVARSYGMFVVGPGCPGQLYSDWEVEETDPRAVQVADLFRAARLAAGR